MQKKFEFNKTVFVLTVFLKGFFDYLGGTSDRNLFSCIRLEEKNGQLVLGQQPKK